jgi:NodT family efflux transporter outer membrane factor (OMF) lipoprotein
MNTHGSLPRRTASAVLGATSLIAVLLTGCAVGPNPRTPAVTLPDRYHSVETNNPAPPEAPSSKDTPALAQWWKLFGDPQLEELITRALSSNLDLRLAESRVREARALRAIARAPLFPGLDADGSLSRSRLSENSPNGQLLSGTGRSLELDSFNAGLSMNWEIDVFGGRRRASQAAKADLEAQAEHREGIRLALLAEVGVTYLDLRGFQNERAVALETLRIQEETLALTRDRVRAGLTSDLDTTRAEAQVARTRAGIPPLEESLQRTVHRLGILLGRPPAELEPELTSPRALPRVPAELPGGLPSDLLRRRPDIRRAERELAAATARIGVATADLFPKFQLTGTAGLQSLDAGDFFAPESRLWSIGPSVRWPIFSAGRIRQQIRAANEREEQAAIRYEQTILTSLEEVENSLVAVLREQDRIRALADSESAGRRAAALANERYRGGLVDFLAVLDAERVLLEARLSLAESERNAAKKWVQLFRALGGGWG